MNDHFSIFDDLSTVPLTHTTPINTDPKQTTITDHLLFDKTRHEAIVPLNTDYIDIQILNSYPYKSYPFQLDTFQKLALSSLHNNHSVLVSAHTSSGKTVIAEYAIAMSLQNSQRVIYTSPIKALSNQKYRELSEHYDVGLMTGDVTLNPNASCLVMTTEILRNMLYRGNEIMREVKWIIFDEIHYIKEKERGVVWEECIIMAPKDVRMVFLSATVPNACEFAEWVCEVTGAIVHVVYTEKRPTPLEHFLVVKGSEKMHRILYEKKSENDIEYVNEELNIKEDTKYVKGNDKNLCEEVNNINEENLNLCEEINIIKEEDKKYINEELNIKKCKIGKISEINENNKIIEIKENTKFDEISRDKNFNEITKLSKIKTNIKENSKENIKENVKSKENNSSTFFDKKAFAEAMKLITSKQKISEDDIKQVLTTMVNQDLLPMIVFSFSRKECEKYALAIDTDFLDQNQKDDIKMIFTNALLNLRQEDRDLPLITSLLPLLLRGIGIHHSGLLPILKEIVEILFQEGLIKVLFATETFSIGLNMPARSVVFTNLSKFDGEERRLLSSGEYIQMSGRAGRRGIDQKGVVAAMTGDIINIKKGVNLFSGLADKLTSAFRLSYNMILNLIRVEGLDTVYLLERSFYHYQSKRGREEYSIKAEKMRNVIDEIDRNRENIVLKYKNYMFDNEDFNNFNNINIVVNDLHPLQMFNILVGYENLRVKKNKLMSPYYLPKLEKGRVIDIFIPRKGSFYELQNMMVVDANKKGVIVSGTVNGNLIKKMFPLEYIDRIYDCRVKNLRNLEMVLKRGLESIKVEEIINEKDKTKKELIINEIVFIENLLYDLSDIIYSIKQGCLICGSKNENSDCMNDRCFDEDDIINYMDTVNNSNMNIRNIFVEEKYRKIYMDILSSLKEMNDIYHMEECKKMLRVLRRLEYCDETTVLTKGRVACEISTGDELLLTEMMFNGDFISLPVEDVVPLLSCIVFPDWDNESTLSEKNNNNYQVLKSMVEKICQVMRDCGMDVDTPTVLKRYSYEMMDIVELWVKGYSFVQICNTTNIFEGTIIRCLKRLEELLKQMASAARNIGNTDLENMFAMGISKIKRDIVFASSLYL